MWRDRSERPTAAQHRAQFPDFPETRTRPPQDERPGSAVRESEIPCRKYSSACFLLQMLALRQYRGPRDPDITHAAKDLALCEETVLVRVHGMRLHFDDEAAREQEDPFQPARRVDRRQREEEIAQAVAAREHGGSAPPVKANSQAPLPSLRRENSAAEGSGRPPAAQEPGCPEQRV